MAWLEECDAVVAEVTTPSLGVGYELGLAEKLGKSILCLFDVVNPDFRLSAMLSGNPKATVARYQTLNEAVVAMDLFMDQNK
jgi:nucleoside 2-deoxyribosyltransferase